MISRGDVAALQKDDVVRIASREEIDRSDTYYWADTMYDYCDKEVEVDHVTSKGHIYMKPMAPHNTAFFFINEWISEIVGADEYTIQPPNDLELQEFIFTEVSCSG